MDFLTTIWFLVSAIAAAIPIPFLKQYTLTHNYQWVIFSIISYMVLILSYIQLLRGRDIIVVYPFLKILSVLVVIITGILFFQDVPEILTIIGIILGIIAIYLLSKKI